MLSESFVILPLKNNKGESLVVEHVEFKRLVLNQFGGYSESLVRGAMRDESTGLVYMDESICYTITADWSQRVSKKRETTLADRLDSIAGAFCRACEQAIVYVKHASGEVKFVKPAAPPPQSVRLTFLQRVELSEAA